MLLIIKLGYITINYQNIGIQICPNLTIQDSEYRQSWLTSWLIVYIILCILEKTGFHMTCIFICLTFLKDYLKKKFAGFSWKDKHNTHYIVDIVVYESDTRVQKCNFFPSFWSARILDFENISFVFSQLWYYYVTIN